MWCGFVRCAAVVPSPSVPHLSPIPDHPTCDVWPMSSSAHARSARWSTDQRRPAPAPSSSSLSPGPPMPVLLPARPPPLLLPGGPSLMLLPARPPPLLPPRLEPCRCSASRAVPPILPTGPPLSIPLLPPLLLLLLPLPLPPLLPLLEPCCHGIASWTMQLIRAGAGCCISARDKATPQSWGGARQFMPGSGFMMQRVPGSGSMSPPGPEPPPGSGDKPRRCPPRL